MSGGACARFKQNAWKKDLCSNCYKPKDEHQAPPPKVYPNLPLIPASQGILKGGGLKKSRKNASVSFPEEESEIIGYGGDAESSDDDDYDFLQSRSEDEGSEGTGGEEEEEKALKLLTKNNTDFNSILGNLNGTAEKAPVAGLMLGRQQKQTLLVSVQPFSSSPTVTAKPVISRLPVEDTTVRCHVAPPPEPSTPPPQDDDDAEEENKKPEQSHEEPVDIVPLVKTVVIETGPPPAEIAPVREEPRSAPEGRKVHITRGNVITKNREHVKNKLYIQNVLQNKSENKRNGFTVKATKPEAETFNKTVIVTCPSVEKNNAKNLLPPLDLPEAEPVVAPVIVKEMPLVEPLKEEVTVKVLKLLDGEEGPPESREMAGEPDGKADSDTPETPLQPPPPRASFLHREHSTPLSSPIILTEAAINNPCITPICEPIVVEPVNRSIKRPAPKPPTAPETPTRPVSGVPDAELILPEPILEVPPPSPVSVIEKAVVVETVPVPRREPPLIPEHRMTPVEKKKALRMKTTLKKLLRFGSREEDGRDEPPPRPRPQIIHPLDLNKTAVQVVPTHLTGKSSPEPTSPSTPTSSFPLPVRPSKPPPPPRSESLNLMERLRATGNVDNIYANLGEARSGIAPIKPQRTGSLREAKNKHCQMQPENENLYECVGINTAPECDMEQRSMPYYGSETESDIYYPNLSFQNREPKNKQKKRGRSVVHTSLEENYGAVVIANLEALTQLLNQLSDTRQDDPKLVPCSSGTLRWNDFSIPEPIEMTVINNVTFVQALHRDIPITLAASINDIKTIEQFGVVEYFTDSLPSSFLEKSEMPLYQTANVGVLRRLKVESLLEYGKKLDSNLETVREGALALLQVLRHMKNNQGNVALSDFAVLTSKTDPGPTVCYMPAKGKIGTRPEEFLKEASKLLVGGIGGVAEAIEACGLSDAVCIVQAWLWGPSSPLPLSALKRWLDLERANTLHNLVCVKSLPAHDREHLRFLVSTDADLLAKTSQLIQHNTQFSKD